MYFVSPLASDACAASIASAGAGKSGWPTQSETTRLPCASSFHTISMTRRMPERLSSEGTRDRRIVVGVGARPRVVSAAATRSARCERRESERVEV